MSLRQQIECERHLSAVSCLKGLYLFVNQVFVYIQNVHILENIFRMLEVVTSNSFGNSYIFLRAFQLSLIGYQNMKHVLLETLFSESFLQNG